MTWRALSVALVLAAVPWLGGCGMDAPPEPPPKQLQEEARLAAARLDWDDAALLYRRAFALEDPRPERQAVRAWLAMRSGWALHRAGQPADALLWLRWAERLDPTLAPVLFERALILDGVYPETASPDGAREAFQAFLRIWETNGSAPELEAMVEEARARIERLGGDAAEDGD